jgi:aryl-alcohol dehydrogenase-like predicted oxidoreductase
MEYRRLGRAELPISPIGLGTWAMSGTGWNQGWGDQDDEVSIATIRRALDLGINWIDTAATYGIGHSEEVVGRAIAPLTDKPLVFTKCGVVRDPLRPQQAPIRSLAPASIRAEVEGSLRRLGVERLDLLQFHFPDEVGTPVEESWATMAELIDEGKVRAAGLSNFPIELMQACQRIRPVDCVQPGLSLIHRESLAETLPWCAANGISAIVFSPLRSGLLTDSFQAADVAAFDESDWRREHADFTPPALPRNIALRDALVPVAARWDGSVSSVALAWALAQPGVTGVIAGARAPHELEAWVGAASIELDQPSLAEIRAALRGTGAGHGPIDAVRPD